MHCVAITVCVVDDAVEIPLTDIVHVQKGFSHAGHMRAGNNRAMWRVMMNMYTGDQYNPIKCFSLTVLQDGRHYYYDLKTYSAQHCQQ